MRVREEGVQDQTVTKELNTLLTALYVLIDDHVHGQAERAAAVVSSDLLQASTWPSANVVVSEQDRLRDSQLPYGEAWPTAAIRR